MRYLRLWKVASLIPGRAPFDFLFQPNAAVPIDPDRSLAQRVKSLITYGKELSAGEKVGKLYPEPHSEEHLHIVVQRPDISPNGECGSLFLYEQN